MKPLIDSDEEAELVKKQLERKISNDPLIKPSEYSKDKINWIDGFKSYGEVKAKNKEVVGDSNDLVLLASPINKVEGKPQLIHENIQRIMMVKRAVKIETVRDGYGNIKGEQYTTQQLFIDEKYDKRSDGFLRDTLCFDFFTYRVIFNNKEYYILSQQRLPNEYCIFDGMNIELMI